jgi:hypothetical protein
VRDERLADSALLALRVVIETSDERFAAARGSPFTFTHPVLHFLLEEGDDYRTLDIPLSMTAKDWQSTDGRYRYTRDVLVKVPLGAYLLRVLELYLGETSDYNTRTIYYQLWYPRVGFTVSEPRSYAMGALLLNLDAVEGAWLRNMKISSRLSLDQGPAEAAANATAIAERSPSLASDPLPLAVHYAYSLIAPQVYDDVLDRREDALWPNTSSDRIEAGFERSPFYLRKKISDDMLDFVRPASIQRLPQSYDIEWDARLINGNPGKRFGLMLGEDERNSLVFATSGSGAVAVLHIVDGAWQKRLLEPAPSAARTMQSGESSRYLVSVRGSRVRFTVNGALLGEFTTGFDLSQAFLAPFLESEGVLSIGRFRITGFP